MSCHQVLSGWRESDPRLNLGRIARYHYATPARELNSRERPIALEVPPTRAPFHGVRGTADARESQRARTVPHAPNEAPGRACGTRHTRRAPSPRARRASRVSGRRDGRGSDPRVREGRRTGRRAPARPVSPAETAPHVEHRESRPADPPATRATARRPTVSGSP